MSPPKYIMARAVYATEQSLFDMCRIRCDERITKFPKTKPNTTVTNCHEYPKYTHKSLRNLYEKSVQKIIQTRQSNLKKFDLQEHIISLPKRFPNENKHKK